MNITYHACACPEPGPGIPPRYVGVWARTWISYAVCRGLRQDLDFLRGMSGSEPGPGCPTLYVGVWTRTWISYAVCRGLSQDLDVLRGMSWSEPGPGCPTRYVGVWAKTWMSYAVCRGLSQDLDVLRGMSGSLLCSMVWGGRWLFVFDGIGGIVDHYWWNCWPLLFKLSFHNSLAPSLIINVVCILYRDLHFSIYQNK